MYVYGRCLQQEGRRQKADILTVAFVAVLIPSSAIYGKVFSSLKIVQNALKPRQDRSCINRIRSALYRL